MRCPYCGNADTQVKDSRPSEDGLSIRRRRYCAECDSRFTTYERVQSRELTVVKSNGEKRPFDPGKLSRSIQIATRKRDVDLETIEQLVNRIMRQLEGEGEGDITTRQIGELVMNELKKLDKVAYIRFASVYRNFSEAGEFDKLIKEIGEEKPS